MDLSPLIALAAGQHGVVSSTQAAHLGVGRPQWRRWRNAGVLCELFDDVALVGGAPPTDRALMSAALLAVGSPAIVSHTSAAAVWGVPVVGINPVHLTVADRRHRADPRGVMVHRPRDTLGLDPTTRDRLAVTRPARTLIDLAGVEPTAASAALRHFIEARLLTPTSIREALAMHRRRGRPGVSALDAALSGLALGDQAADSVLEERMARLLRRHRIPFDFHAVIAGWEVHFLISGTRVVVETDGWAFHGIDHEQFERDRDKDAELGAAGYVVRRFTWHHVTQREAWTIDQIRATLRQWGPAA